MKIVLSIFFPRRCCPAPTIHQVYSNDLFQRVMYIQPVMSHGCGLGSMHTRTHTCAHPVPIGPLRGVRRSPRGLRRYTVRACVIYPDPGNVWDLDILVIFPYHVTSQMFTVEMANCFDSAISYSLDKLGCSHLTLKDGQRLAMKAVYDGSNVFLCLPTGKTTLALHHS